MPVTGFTVGRDVTLAVNLPNGPVTFSNVTEFHAKQMTKNIESKGLDGVDRFGELPAGWEGGIEIDRADANMDIAFSYLEGLYYQGLNVPASQITETITEPTGGITQWRFIGVAFKYDDHGSFKGDAKVTQKLSWKCSQRIRVA